MVDMLEVLQIAFLAAEGFEQIEMTSPRQALGEAGAVTHLVAPVEGSIRAWDADDWGDRFEVDRTLQEADPDDYDALLLPGGVLNSDRLRTDARAVAFVRAFLDAGKPVAAIGHGPWIFIDAGVAGGRRLTSYPSLRSDLQNAGALWVDEPVVVEDGLLTSRQPDDLPAFKEAVLEELARMKEAA